MKKHKLPTLYAHSKSGKVKQWDISVISNNENSAIIQTIYGYIDGEKQISEVDVVSGKNIGRSNETSAWEQACSEAESKWKKEIDGGYTTKYLEEADAGEEQNEGKYPLPMLAKKYLECLHTIEFPVLTQFKLNGVRCRSGIIDGEFAMWSRKGKLYSVLMDKFADALIPLLDNLNRILPNAHFDGEAYSHGLPLQVINSGVKRKNDITNNICYWIYDITAPDLDQIERDEIRRAVLKDAPNNLIVCVNSIECNSDKEVQEQLQKARKLKYEGLIIRKKSGSNSRYLNRHRSDGLLKLKEFHDREYLIIGGKEGKGKFKGSITFRCITDEGKEFDVVPTGTMEERRQWFRELDTFIGKYITVRYQDLSQDGIPTILTGVDAAVIRDYE